jgi:uncharacterized protein (TIGR02246 family)
MKTRIFLTCLAFGAICLAVRLAPMWSQQPASGGSTAATAAKPAGEEAALHQAAASYSAAFARGDSAAVLAMWTPDAEFIDDEGKVYRGHEALAPLFAKSLPSFKGYKITSKLTSVRFVKPDVALVDGEQTFTPPQGETDISRFTSVWVKDGGQWRIRSARDLSPEPAGETVAGRRLREMEWLVGDWISDGKDAAVHVKASWALNKAFLLMEYEVKTKQGPGSKVAQWMGWDPVTGQIKSWVFDDHGGYGETLWQRSGNTWTGEAAGVLPDGDSGSAVNVLKYVDDQTFQWQSLRREAAGRPMPDAEAKFTRSTPKH